MMDIRFHMQYDIGDDKTIWSATWVDGDEMKVLPSYSLSDLMESLQDVLVKEFTPVHTAYEGSEQVMQ